MVQRAYLGTRKGLFQCDLDDDGGSSLALVQFAGDPVSMLLHDSRDGAMYAALRLGHFGAKLHRREVDGGAWREIAMLAFPAKPADSGDAFDWTVRQIWALAAGGMDQPGVLWAGTLPGGLFRSNDRGDSWQLVESLWNVPQRAQWFGGGYDVPGIHSICVNPRDSDKVLLGVSCGGVWQTADGGASWVLTSTGMRADYMPPELDENEAVQDPHRFVRSQAMPDMLWCQHHNGIWRSEDGGHHWQEIGSAPLSHFGFAVAVHPRDGGTAWFVPAQADVLRIPHDGALAVTRTRDGGQTFEVLREGLPQRHCYDLVYRHGLALADDGRSLLMASTTGGAWYSSDGGELWQTLSAHLPPVYVVCFSTL